MKKDLYLLVALMTLVSFFSLVACQKEGDGKILFTATIETPSIQSKTSITNTGVMTWLNGDQIAVFDNGGSGVVSHLTATPTGNHKTADFTLVSGYEEPSDGPYYAIYPASIATAYNTITLPTEYTYDDSRFDAPMYAYSTNNKLVFKNLCGVMQLNLTTNKSINSIVITTDQAITGEFCLDYNGGSPNMITTQNNSNTLTINFDNSVDCSGTGQSFYVYLPIGNYSEMSITFYTTDASYCTKSLQSGQTFIVGRNTLNPLNFNNPQFRPIGSKGGLFTINENGDQVWFSQGNMQYKASTNIWRFAEHQYDFVGDATLGNVYENGVKCNNAYISSNYSGWIDLFGWGTSGWNSGANAYRPYSNMGTSNNDYWPGGSYENGLTGEYAEADWAWHNCIQNAGNIAHTWRTLSVHEWCYLILTRTDAELKYGTGNVNGIGGLIILPDDWVLPTGCSFTPGVISKSPFAAASSNDWTLNNYTLLQWEKMEVAGAIFLPASGYRIGLNVPDVGIDGMYWSTTPFLGTIGYEHGRAAHFLLIYGNSVGPNTIGYGRSYGFSVRPIRDNI